MDQDGVSLASMLATMWRQYQESQTKCAELTSLVTQLREERDALKAQDEQDGPIRE